MSHRSKIRRDFIPFQLSLLYDFRSFHSPVETLYSHVQSSWQVSTQNADLPYIYTKASIKSLFPSITLCCIDRLTSSVDTGVGVYPSSLYTTKSSPAHKS